MVKKENLSDAIENALKKKRSSVSKVARDLERPAQTVHSWIKRNTFPEAMIQQVMEAAGMKFPGLESLKEKFSFNLNQRLRNQNGPVALKFPTIAVTEEDIAFLGRMQVELGDSFTLDLAVDLIRRRHGM